MKFDYHVWRPNPYLLEHLETWGPDRAVPLWPDPLLIGGEAFDPIEHFQEWRKRDREDMAELERFANAGLDAAFRQFPRQWTKMAGWLNEREIKSYNGRPWTADNVRHSVKRREAENDRLRD